MRYYLWGVSATRDAGGTGGRQTLSLAVKCPQRISAAPEGGAAGAPGLPGDLGPCQLLQRPAPPLPRWLGSGETAAGAWERDAPAGVGLRCRGSRGTAGPWEPGTRKRRAAEVGEGWRRAPALASLPAAAGSPLGRGRSHFQAGRKVPRAHPCPAAGHARLHSARSPPATRRPGAGLRTLRSTCCAAPRRRSPAAGTRAGSRPTRTCCWRLVGSPAGTHPHPGREGARGERGPAEPGGH